MEAPIRADVLTFYLTRPAVRIRGHRALALLIPEAHDVDIGAEWRAQQPDS